MNEPKNLLQVLEHNKVDTVRMYRKGGKWLIFLNQSLHPMILDPTTLIISDKITTTIDKN